MKKLNIIIFLFLLVSVSAAKDRQSPVKAFRLEEPIKIDGILNEAIWAEAPAITNFIQKNPIEGAVPSEESKVYILYDEDALYVGACLYDSEPGEIMAKLGRRDNAPDSDLFGFFIDPYYDHRSGYYFGVNAAGTLYDGIMYNDDWDDDSWDGVWEGKSSINEEGWCVEMRIPYSQLRFHQSDSYKWAINFRRDIARKREEIYLVFTPKDGSGFVSRFIDLVGIEKIKPTRNLEFLPYVRGKAEFIPADKDDPFNDGSEFSQGIGTDIKMGIGNNLTLDATVNPDFGQVEVDPAVVNLSDVETFYDEKRPFFIEGSSIFNFGYGGSRSHWGFNWGNPEFFYTRRLGKSPQGDIDEDYDYSSRPDGTQILGAAKLTGKLGKNWNFGTVHAITNREYARFSDADGNRFKSEIEPLSYYGVIRAQKDINDGFQGLGFIGTTTHRFFNEAYLKDQINSDALTGGIDGWTFLDQERVWVLCGWMGFSHVTGTKERILDLQQDSRHYFQRPDASHIEVDPDRTSLTGFAGRLLLNKQKGNFFINSAVGFVDPGFDVNDLGFMWRSDIINTHFGFGYKWTKPSNWYREMQLIGALFSTWDFDYNTTWSGIWTLGYFQFLNYYSFEYNLAYNPENISNRSTRGGPLMIQKPGYQFSGHFNTDSRKNLVGGTNWFTYFHESGSRTYQLGVELQWKPIDNIFISFEPQYMYDYTDAFYVTDVEDATADHTFDKRYVFATLDQREFSAGFRINWTFTPELSLQLFAQPLFSVGDYYNYRELAEPKSYSFTGYGDENLELEDDTYYFDPDGDGPAEQFSWDNPDFNIKSIRGNAVLRWEYLPGSTFYFVWTQSRFNFSYDPDFNFNNYSHKLLDLRADNIFMLKMTYWLGV